MGCLSVFGINTTVGVEHARPILLMCRNYCRLLEGSSILDPYNEHHPETGYAPAGVAHALSRDDVLKAGSNDWSEFVSQGPDQNPGRNAIALQAAGDVPAGAVAQLLLEGARRGALGPGRQSLCRHVSQRRRRLHSGVRRS